MTKRFNVQITCERCGHQMPAETAFGRWMRENQQLESSNGIVRTDCDHIILRYKTHKDGRDFQLMMIVEAKEYGREPDPCQTDILSFLAQTLQMRGQQVHGAKTHRSVRLKSRLLNRDVLVRNFGVHLLQFEKTSPKDSKWIKWDRREINPQVLTEILAFDRRPDRPDMKMIEFLRDRHKKPQPPPLFGESA